MTTTSLSLPGQATAGAINTRNRHHRGVGRWVVLGILGLLLLLTLFPFLLAIINAIKTGADYAVHGPLAIPQSFDLSALGNFWTEVDFTRKLFNSVLISACVAIFAVLLSVLNAYAIGIGRVRGGKALLVVLLMGIMVPQESLVYPIYYMAKAVGLYNTIAGVIIGRSRSGAEV